MPQQKSALRRITGFNVLKDNDLQILFAVQHN